MSDSDNHTSRLLKKLRDDIAGVKGDMRSGFAFVDKRFDEMNARIESIKQAAFGESLIGRYIAAEVEERLVKLEDIIASRRS